MFKLAVCVLCSHAGEFRRPQPRHGSGPLFSPSHKITIERHFKNADLIKEGRFKKKEKPSSKTDVLYIKAFSCFFIPYFFTSQHRDVRYFL